MTTKGERREKRRRRKMAVVGRSVRLLMAIILAKARKKEARCD